MGSEWDIRARAVLAGGASSPVRAGRRVGGMPFYQTRGEGALAYDVTGRAYIDYLMGYGPLLFGYRLPDRERLMRLFEHGVLFGSTHEAEIALAERIRAHLPSMERIRFTTTGTEAVMGAVRLARAVTQRPLVVRFGGNYHGHFDLALLAAGASAETSDAVRAGIPSGVVADVRVLRYNDLPALETLLAVEGGRVAAVLIEPIVGNMGLVMPHDGYLAALAAATRRAGALLIFDEVITWLRLGLAGAQGRLAVCPDITAIGKILGGGLPIAAFGGRAEVMRFLAPDGPVFTGGTHAGNPLAVAAGHAVLDEIERSPNLYRDLAARAADLAQGLREIVASCGLGYPVQHLESIVDVTFRAGPPVGDAEDAAQIDRARFAAYYHAMRERGILLPPSSNEVMFLSTEHRDEHIVETLQAARAALTATP